MYQIKVNGILMPTIYWSLREAIEACQHEAERGCAVMTDIISVEQIKKRKIIPLLIVN